jgi:hypothetical protein
LIDVIEGKSHAVSVAGMKEHYAKAEAIGIATHDSTFFYPAMNRIVADLAHRGRGETKRIEAATIAAVRKGLDDKARRDPDFWSIVGLTELRMYEAIDSRSLAAAQQSIRSEFEDHWSRANTPWKWASVYDTASLVLPAYATSSTGAEKKAATDLRKLLRKFAGMPG